MQESFKGPLVLAFSREDPGAAARVVKAFRQGPRQARDGRFVARRRGVCSGDLDRLASLPTLDEARAMLLGVLAGAPVAAGPHAGRARRDAGAHAQGRSERAGGVKPAASDGNQVTHIDRSKNMALSNEELIEALSNKPIMEIVDLVKALEEKWGVSAAAPVAVAAAGAGGAAEPPPSRSRPSSTS
jgi:hypothetical protein